MKDNVVDVVIGAVYGDEGKGLMTDYLAAEHISEGKSVAVVRFNGGAQAGHTVVRDGIRHVFQHIGSGTLAGADTILSHTFCINPIAFLREYKELNEKIPGGIKTEIYVDRECPITTPYDIFINQALERKRGNDRHGSCGMGIGVTVERSENAWKTGAEVRAWHMIHTQKLERQLIKVRKWFIAECERLELTEMPHYQDVLSDALLANFMSDCQLMDRIVKVENLWRYNTRGKYDRLVFEGAQGLGLDQLFGTFPYVTRSFTGLRNVLSLFSANNEFDSTVFNVHYMTRAYGTRHGAGPLFGEVPHRLPKVVDETNSPNEFQGTMRFADLDITGLGERISMDLTSAKVLTVGKAVIQPSLVITCMDQLDDRVDVIMNNRRIGISSSELIAQVQFGLSIPISHVSYGPTANDVKVVVND